MHSHQDHAWRWRSSWSAPRLPARRQPSSTAATDRRSRASLERLHRCAAGTACASPSSAAATTRWIATSAGTASRRPTTRWSRPRRRASPMPPAAIDDAYARQRHRRVRRCPRSIGDYGGIRGDGLAAASTCARPRARILAALSIPFSRLTARARRALRHRSRHDARRRRARTLMRRFSFPDASHHPGEVVAGRRHARSCAWRRPRNTPHVTYFLNGGREDAVPGEDRIMVPSPKVATYDLQPEMSAPELTDKAVAAIDCGQIRPDRAATTPIPTWSATPAACRPRSRRWRRSTPASAASPRRSDRRAARCWSPPTTAIAR